MATNSLMPRGMPYLIWAVVGKGAERDLLLPPYCLRQISAVQEHTQTSNHSDVPGSGTICGIRSHQSIYTVLTELLGGARSNGGPKQPAHSTKLIRLTVL